MTPGCQDEDRSGNELGALGFYRAFVAPSLVEVLRKRRSPRHYGYPTGRRTGSSRPDIVRRPEGLAFVKDTKGRRLQVRRAVAWFRYAIAEVHEKEVQPSRLPTFEMIKGRMTDSPPVRLEDRQWAGLFLFAGTTQFAIGMIIAESVDPSYSVSTNYISDLGVRAGAAIFNSSIIILGLTILATSWFILRAFRDRILMVVVLLSGVGATGVGVFTENAPDSLHTIVSFITFLFAALSAILAFRILRPPFSYVSVILGLGSLVALALFISNNYLGLGAGGMERMIVYPVLTWAIGFGGALLGGNVKAAPAPSG